MKYIVMVLLFLVACSGSQEKEPVDGGSIIIESGTEVDKCILILEKDKCTEPCKWAKATDETGKEGCLDTKGFSKYSRRKYP